MTATPTPRKEEIRARLSARPGQANFEPAYMYKNVHEDATFLLEQLDQAEQDRDGFRNGQLQVQDAYYHAFDDMMAAKGHVARLEAKLAASEARETRMREALEQMREGLDSGRAGLRDAKAREVGGAAEALRIFNVLIKGINDALAEPAAPACHDPGHASSRGGCDHCWAKPARDVPGPESDVNEGHV